MTVLGGLLPGRGRAAGAAPAPDLTLLYADKLTFGATPALVDEIRSAGPQAWLDQQLDPASIREDLQLELALATFTSFAYQGSAKQAAPFGEVGLKDLQVASLLRAVRSKRQLHELMAGFWHDHFNVAPLTGPLMMLAADYDRAIRAHTFGRFADLLLATARSAAMMVYLDNARSRWPDPNENYAREVMELHTVGVDGGYDEGDVWQAALTFTGWGTTALNGSDNTFGFAFHPEFHYSEGPVRVMGWSAPAMAGPGSIAQGEALLAYLARHPATARHLSSKLVRRFLGDGEYPGLVDRLARVFLEHDTEIVPWLRALIGSAEFRSSAGSKLRRPFEHLAASLRGLQPMVQAEGGGLSEFGRGVLPLLTRLGHSPFTWAAPDGYPDEDVYWAASGSVLARWNGLLALVRNAVPGVYVDLDGRLRRSVATGTVAELVDGLAERLLQRRLPAADRSALIDYLGEANAPAGDLPDTKFRTACALILCTPGAQVR